MSLLGDDQRSIQERLSQLFDGCVEWSAADWANVAAFAARHSELDDEAYRSLVRDLGKSPLVTVDDESEKRLLRSVAFWSESSKARALAEKELDSSAQ